MDCRNGFCTAEADRCLLRPLPRKPQVPYAAGPWAEKTAFEIPILHHTLERMSSTDAIAVAAAAAAANNYAPVAAAADHGFEPGQAVTVAATDYGSDPVAGALVGLSTDEVVIQRQDPRVGTVQVHFPRFGFQIKKALAA